MCGNLEKPYIYTKWGYEREKVIESTTRIMLCKALMFNDFIDNSMSILFNVVLSLTLAFRHPKNSQSTYRKGRSTCANKTFSPSTYGSIDKHDQMLSEIFMWIQWGPYTHHGITPIRRKIAHEKGAWKCVDNRLEFFVGAWIGCIGSDIQDHQFASSTFLEPF